MKTIMKLYPNGDLETLGVALIQSDVANHYEFNKDTITVPKIIKYNPNKTMPSWVLDTGSAISMFPEGVVIKGQVIEKDNPLIIFEDDFNRADTEAFLGNGWGTFSGRIRIENNQAVNLVSQTVHNRVAYDVGTQDYISISCEITSDGLIEGGILFRVMGSQDNISAYWVRDILHLTYRVNNNQTWIKSVSGVFTRGQTHELRVELRGTEIKVFVDSEIKITAYESRYMNTTKCGIFTSSNTSSKVKFDNFKVKRLT